MSTNNNQFPQPSPPQKILIITVINISGFIIHIT